ncbi:MAG: rhomboid family intramembrane serine protease [Hyphomicrobiaceae bacterium]
MTDRTARQPIFNAPSIVLVVLGVLVAVHAARLLLPDETDFRVVLALALIPGRARIAADIPGGELAVWTQYLSHMLLHGDMAHLMINGAWLLVFGTVMARRLSAARFLLALLVGGVAGGLAFSLSHDGELQPMVGASGAVSALMGAVMRLLFSAIDLGGAGLLNRYAQVVPRVPLARALVDRRIVMTSVVIVALNLLLATAFGTFLAGGTIAWEAHLGGYFAGLLGFGLIDNGPVQGRPPASPSGDEAPEAPNPPQGRDAD